MLFLRLVSILAMAWLIACSAKATATPMPSAAPLRTATPSATPPATPRATSSATIPNPSATATSASSVTPVPSTAATANPTIVETPNPLLPYLQLAPSTALNGQQVLAFGKDFCPVGCSPITLRVGENIVVENLAVNDDGTFQASFFVNVVPALYSVSASQTSADGRMIEARAPLIVPAVDFPPATGTRTP